MIVLPLCLECKHWQGGIQPLYCAAFPAGVPDEIRSGIKRHFKPIEGDHGLQFEPVDDAPQWVFEFIAGQTP